MVMWRILSTWTCNWSIVMLTFDNHAKWRKKDKIYMDIQNKYKIYTQILLHYHLSSVCIWNCDAWDECQTKTFFFWFNWIACLKLPLWELYHETICFCCFLFLAFIFVFLFLSLDLQFVFIDILHLVAN